MLTHKQHELLVFINERLTQTGVSPSFDEMKDALRVRSKGGIHRLVTALEERGFLARRHHRARALEVLRLPEDVTGGRRRAGSMRTASAGYARRVGSSARAGDLLAVIQVPLHGRIAAGPPVEAPRASGDHLAVPAALLADAARDHYALEVAGDSMADAGILEGDMVIIRRDATVENGKIAVASVNGHATLKRVFRHGNEVALKSANIRYPTRVFPAEMVTVEGPLVALLRRY